MPNSHVISYSTSKESTLLASLGARDEAIDTMAYIIEAIKAGRLELEPKDDSGWYDYQWYALENASVAGQGPGSGETETLGLKQQETARRRLSNVL